MANAAAIAVAPQLVEAGRPSPRARRSSTVLPGPRELVGAPAADLDRRVGGRHLADRPVGRCSGSAGVRPVRRSRPPGRPWSTPARAGPPSRRSSEPIRKRCDARGPADAARAAVPSRRGRACRRGRPSPRGPSRARDAAATTSCEVIPAGLSTRTQPVESWRAAGAQAGGAARPASLLRRARGAGRSTRSGISELRGEAGGLAVAAAALRARDRGNVDAAGRRRAGTPCACRRGSGRAVAHERGDDGALERAQVVDDALGVALLGARRRRSRPSTGARGERAVVVALDAGQAARRAGRAWRAARPRRARR